MVLLEGVMQMPYLSLSNPLMTIPEISVFIQMGRGAVVPAATFWKGMVWNTFKHPVGPIDPFHLNLSLSGSKTGQSI